MTHGHFFELLKAVAFWTPPQGVLFIFVASPSDGAINVSLRLPCGCVHMVGFTCVTPTATAIEALDRAAAMVCGDIAEPPTFGLNATLREAGEAFEASLGTIGGPKP